MIQYKHDIVSEKLILSIHIFVVCTLNHFFFLSSFLLLEGGGGGVGWGVEGGVGGGSSEHLSKVHLWVTKSE